MFVKLTITVGKLLELQLSVLKYLVQRMELQCPKLLYVKADFQMEEFAILRMGIEIQQELRLIQTLMNAMLQQLILALFMIRH